MFAYLQSLFIPDTSAQEYVFDAQNSSVRAYKYTTTAPIDASLTPSVVRSFGTELSAPEYNLVKTLDSSVASVSTSTGSENSLYLYEYTLSGIINPTVFKYFQYGFSSSSGSVVYIWNNTTSAWENI